MNGYKFVKRGNMNNKSYFNFKPNLSATHRSSSHISSPFNFGGRQMPKVVERTMVMDDRNAHPKFFDGSLTYEKGYASSLEPMNFDECGGESDYWNECIAYETDPSSSKRKSYPHNTRESLHTNVMKTSKFSCAKPMPFSRQNFIEKPLRQSILKADESCSLGFKLEKKVPRKSSPHGLVDSMMSGKKLYPKWSSAILETKVNLDNKEACFPRIFTVTVEKLQKWPKMLTGSKVIFELYGILENISAGRFKSKRITLKSETMKDRLTCTFYEIDRTLPLVEKGHWQRCIVLFRSKREYQCLTIRSATSNELKNLDKMTTSSSRWKALLLKTTAK